MNIEGLPAWQTKKLYYHLFNRAAPPAPGTPLPGTTYPAGTTIINQQWQDWSRPYPELGGQTPLDVANNGIFQYVSIGGTSLTNQFSTRYSEQYGLYASTVGPDTVGPDGWAHTSFFENIDLGAPLLSITDTGNRIVVSWPYPSSGFLLEQNTNLADRAGWSTYGGTVSTNNGVNSITNTLPAGNLFFRLSRRP